jgi:hypothetical protein
MPFDGELKQDGLLLQPLDNSNNPIIGASLQGLTFNRSPEKFFMNTGVYGQPEEYTFYNNQILLYPIPDKPYTLTCLYTCNNYAQSVTTVDTVSSAGQKVLSVASTTEYSLNDIVYINKGKSTEETGVVSSVQAGVSLTLVGNLTFTHQVGERVTVERQILQYANDEPNFDSVYHNVVLYGTLVRLLYNDARQEVYNQALQTSLTNLVSRSKGSQSNRQGIRVTKYYW